MSTQEKILEFLNEPVFEMDTTGRITFATTALSKWIGKETGFNFADVLNAEDRPRFEKAVKRLSADHTTSTLLELSLDQDGHPVPVEIKLSRGQRDGAKVLTITGWVRDTSMEKAKESSANVQGTHLLDLVENISDACVVENADGNVEMVNTAFCELFGVTSAPQSLVGMSCNDLFVQASALTDRKIAPIYFPLDTAGNDEFDFAFTSGAKGRQHSLPVDGEEGIAGRLHIFRALGDDAKATGGSATITAQSKIVEKIARELAITLESAASAIHRAEQLDLPNTVLDHFRHVESAAQTAFNEIAGLIDLSHFEAGDLQLETSEFQLRESVSNMLDRLVPLAEDKIIQLRVSVEQDVPEHLVGDGARLMLVLRSLMESGVPSAQNGGDIALLIEPQYSADNQIYLSFRIEISPLRGGMRQKNVSPTSLLQISLARQIVRAMSGAANGRIDMRERKETTIYQFTSDFPYRTVAEPRNRPSYVTLTGMPVLIVSADAMQRKELAELARSWRMLPREADNAAVALQLLVRMADENNPVPLVLTANHLPVQDGFLLAFRIKHHHKLKQTSIMMLAKGGKPGDAIACRENGVSAYLRHPVAPTQINEAISAVMGTQAGDSEATSTLITRHSLREAKAGSILLVDPNREHAVVPMGTLKKKDYRVVHVDTAEQAFAELDQDVFDLLIIDPMAKGFAELGIEGIADRLQEKFAKSSASIPVLLAVEEDISAVEFGFSGTLAKPYDREALLKKVASLIPAKVAA